MRDDVRSRSTPGRAVRVLEPAEILEELLELDPDLGLESYYSERAIFYNPQRRAPLGVIFAAVKDHDGPNDDRSRLDRPGVYRFAFQLPREAFVEHFGEVPPRPAKGRFVRLDQDPTVLDELTPHPVYAWMRWVQVLCPTRTHFGSMRPLLIDSLRSVKERWAKRSSSR